MQPELSYILRLFQYDSFLENRYIVNLFYYLKVPITLFIQLTHLNMFLKNISLANVISFLFRRILIVIYELKEDTGKYCINAEVNILTS